ncbi:MAG: hypothetical protein GXP54_04700 [Deltaproteobacteria bacterium]|nr:hypothetical protein [Deltaproteobacteria bacterium]
MRTTGVLVIVLLALTMASPAMASSEGDTWKSKASIPFGRFALNLGGELRFIGGRIGEMAVELADPSREDRIPTEGFLTYRLRWSPSLVWKPDNKIVRKVAIMTEVDFLDGTIIAGDGRSVLKFADKSRIEQDAFKADNIRLREAYLGFGGPFFGVKVGRQLSHWGLGILANNGREVEGDFGYRNFGDVVERVLVSIKPLQFFTHEKWGQSFSINVAGDYIERDVFSNRGKGDTAWQALASLHWQGQMGQAGFLYISRWQENDLGDKTRAHILDLFLNLTMKAGDVALGVAGEWSGVYGHTEMPRNMAYPDGVDISASAMTARASLTHKWFNVVLEVGRASGDQDAFDDTFHSFTMNPDYRVGLLLFPEAAKAVSAVTAFNMADPTYSGAPTRGFNGVVTNGGVTNAIYAFPRITGTFPHLDISLGVLVARAEVPLVDPFQAALLGGAAIGPRGGPATRDLGYEVDLAARTTWDLGGWVRLLAVVEYAYWRPGSAFADTTGLEPDGVHLVQGRLHLQW